MVRVHFHAVLDQRDNEAGVGVVSGYGNRSGEGYLFVSRDMYLMFSSSWALVMLHSQVDAIPCRGQKPATSSAQKANAPNDLCCAAFKRSLNSDAYAVPEALY